MFNCTRVCETIVCWVFRYMRPQVVASRAQPSCYATHGFVLCCVLLPTSIARLTNMSSMLTDFTCSENPLEVIREKAEDWMRSCSNVRTAPKYWHQRQSACYCVRKSLKSEHNSAFLLITCLRGRRAREDVLFEYSCS